MRLIRRLTQKELVNRAGISLPTIAKTANLTPEKQCGSKPRLHAQSNMVEWGFVYLLDKIGELKAGATATR